MATVIARSLSSRLSLLNRRISLTPSSISPQVVPYHLSSSPRILLFSTKTTAKISKAQEEEARRKVVGALLDMCKGLRQDGYEEQALDVFHQIFYDNGKCGPPLVVYAIMEIIISFTQIKPSHALMVWHRDGLIRIPVDKFKVEVYIQPITSTKLKGKMEEDRQNVYGSFLHSGGVPNAYTYAVLIRGLSRHDIIMVTKAKCLMMEMIRKGMKPNAATVVALMEGLVRENKVEEGRKLVEEMTPWGLLPGDEAIEEILEGKKGPVVDIVRKILFPK